MPVTLIQSQTLGASAASVTFSAIPGVYKSLWLRLSVRSDTSATSTTWLISVNGASTSLAYQRLYGTGSGASVSFAATGISGEIDAATATTSIFSNAEIIIPNYTSSANKPMSALSVAENNSTTYQQSLIAVLWSGTTAITSLTATPGAGNFIAGSTFYLYALK